MTKTALALGAALAAAVLAAACGSSDDASVGGDDQAQAPAPGSNDPRAPGLEALPDPFASLPKGKEQLDKVCARGQRDEVTRALCDAPSIGSIRDLQEALGLGFRDRSEDGRNGLDGNPAFALLGHSTSLVARSVSAINPRAFIFTPPPGRPARMPGFVVMGFARGEPFVEIAAEDPERRKLTFYLLKFDLACEAEGCTPGDMLTPAVEQGWQGWTLYQDEDLKNTIVDCRHCHQPGGPDTKPMLRMQELQDPWTHWFRNDRPGGIALFEDFLAAHGPDEDYAGIPAEILQKADGRAMEDFVTGQGFGDQPNAFDSEQIEREVSRSADEQPEVNMPMGESPTWQRLYDRAASGEFIPVPYHDVKVTDPDKLAFATDAYQKFRAGTLDKADLPDIRRVFLDDALPEMMMRPPVGATGEEILVAACAQCHNARLDQTISRAHFDVTKLDEMSDAMKKAAVARMKLPASDLRHMPPALFRTLPDDALTRAIDALSK